MSAQNIDSNPLSHLSETQISNLIKRYYLKAPSGSFYERVSDLLEEYKIKLSKGEYVHQFFPAQDSDITCIDCKKNKKLKLFARSRNKVEYIQCCEQKKPDQENSTLEVFFKLEQSRTTEIEEYKASDIIWIMSLIKSLTDQDMLFIKSLNEQKDVPVTPIISESIKMISHLYQHRLISINHNSDKNNLNLNKERNHVESFHLDKVFYSICLNKNNKIDVLEDSFFLEKRLRELISKGQFDVFNLQKLLAYLECEQCLKYQLDKYHFDFIISEKLKDTIWVLMEKLSVSQIYYLISLAVKNAVAFREEKQTTRLHAINTIPIKLESLSIRAISEKWNGWYRSAILPRSALSIVLYETLFGEKEDIGFNKVLVPLK